MEGFCGEVMFKATLHDVVMLMRPEVGHVTGGR